MREKEEKITKGRKQSLCLRWLWRTLWFVGVSVIGVSSSFYSDTGGKCAGGRETDCLCRGTKK